MKVLAFFTACVLTGSIVLAAERTPPAAAKAKPATAADFDKGVIAAEAEDVERPLLELFESRLDAFAVAWLAPTTSVASPSRDENKLRKQLEQARAEIDANKRQIMADALDLDPEQMVTFWEVYDRNQEVLAGAWTKYLDMIRVYAENYDAMSDTVARTTAEEAIRYYDMRKDILRRGFEDMSRAVSPVAAARYFQVENYLQLTIHTRITANLPLIR